MFHSAINVGNYGQPLTDTTQIEVKKMEHQRGSKGCGVFAITVCTPLLIGADVCTVTVSQDKMRRLLFLCFIGKLLTPFPTLYSITCM